MKKLDNIKRDQEQRLRTLKDEQVSAFCCQLYLVLSATYRVIGLQSTLNPNECISRQ